MKRFSQLTEQEKKEVQSKAEDFKFNNPKKVTDYLHAADLSTAPTGDVLFTPENWDANNWKWYCS